MGTGRHPMMMTLVDDRSNQATCSDLSLPAFKGCISLIIVDLDNYVVLKLEFLGDIDSLVHHLKL